MQCQNHIVSQCVNFQMQFFGFFKIVNNNNETAKLKCDEISNQKLWFH